MISPKVSVVMSVRNGMPYLPEAVDSILDQTFTDFEFILLDNASSDLSVDWIEGKCDPRIRFIRNEKDIGLSASLNRGLSAARGEYIARIDADDISLPNRLQAQVAFMDEHPDICVCGGQIEFFGSEARYLKLPCEHKSMCSELFFGVPLAHPTVMFRHKFLQEHGLRYDEKLATTQDYDMWCRISHIKNSQMANLDEVVLHYRVHADNASTVDCRTLEEARIIRIAYLKKMFPCFSSFEAEFFGDIASTCFEANYDFLLRSAGLLNKFLEAVRNDKSFDTQLLQLRIGSTWHNLCAFFLRRRPDLALLAMCNPLFYLLPVTHANHVFRKILRKIGCIMHI